ncbi:hypothetical protein Cni_G01007 [Canna indica]|uniref:Pentatricopeptide repeat-containing protein n=1 Tax=Canna indica TaxID=4628 RepID=A0AAQ3JLR2_9LILI|nr:hypothetical protein Cni_G01007 [Canna indica]
MLPFPIGFCLPFKRIVRYLPLEKHSRKLCGNYCKKMSLDIPSTAERFEYCLQACTDIRLLRKIHARILTDGLGDNIYLRSKFLNCYANFGSLPESRRVFHKIMNKNISLWNSAIVGYFRGGYFEEVLMLYLNLRYEGISLDSSAINFGLKCCIELMNVEVGRSIHIDALKVGLNDNMFVGSSLIGLYFEFGIIKDAQRAFEEIMEKDIVTYTTMVSGYAKFSDFRALGAFEVVSDMHREGLDVNRVTLVSLLQAAGNLQAFGEGRSVHCYSLRRAIGLSDEVLLTSLVDMYAKCGAGHVAASVLRQMEKKTIASWNALITGLNQCGQSSEAFKYFNVMKQDYNLSPDSVTLANVLSACSNLKFVQYNTTLHAYIIRRNILLDKVLITVLIELYSKFNKMKQARKLFDYLISKDTISYNIMISAYLQNGAVKEAIKIFYEMTKASVRPTPATILSLLSTFADIADVRKGRWVHGIVVKYDLQLNIDVSNLILHMYARCGKINLARMIFDLITEKDVVSWTAMMMGYVSFGQGNQAVALFEEMQGTGKEPDSLTIMALLQAHAQLGSLEPVKEIHGYLQRASMVEDVATMNSLIITYAKCGRLDIAETVFGSMTGHELASWNTMIAAYGIHGYCRDALEMFNQMQRENVKPDELTFSSVLSACSHSGLVEEAWCIFNSMKSDYLVSPQEEHYSCMVDLLGRAGQLEEAYNLLKFSPLRHRADALSALLAACKLHKNSKLGEIIGQELLHLDPHSSSTYALMSNVYALAGKWSEAANVWNMARERGLTRTPGYSSFSHASAVLTC